MFLTSFNNAKVEDALNIAVLIFLHNIKASIALKTALIVLIWSHVDGMSRSCGWDKQVTWLG